MNRYQFLHQYCDTTPTVPWLAFCALVTFVLATGCGQYPILSENRKNFAPWERMPERDGIAYIGKFVRDPGHDPVYLARIKYTDNEDLQSIVEEFGLKLSDDQEPLLSYATGDDTPAWFPPTGTTKVYVFPDTHPYGPHYYTATLWVNEEDGVAVLERSWF